MKKITILLTFIFGIALLFNGCQKMEDIHSEYLKDGDIIYAPKPDSIQTFAGRSRVGVKYYLLNASNVNKCIVEWDEGEGTQSVDISPNIPLDSVEFTITNLEEKAYIFKIYTIDKHGNRSIKAQTTGSAYGTRFESTLSNRSLLGIVGGGTTDSITIEWGTATTGHTGVEITYNNAAGEPQTKKVLPGDNITVIKDWESEGTMSYKSLYIPEDNAIDTFMSASKTSLLPVFIEFKGVKIDNANWEIVDFSTEEPGEGAPNGLASAAIDSDLGTFWHTQWAGGNPGYPHHLTIDLKDIVKINKLEFFRRQGDGRGQTKFEIHISLDGTNFTKLGSYDYDATQDNQSYQVNSLPMARYIKYVATAGSNFFAFLSEINIYGQVASQIDRSGWEITDVSSEESDGLASAAIDNDLGTFWHTAWRLSQPDYPHYFIVDMKNTVKVLAVECFRRQGNGQGQTKLKIYTSNDGINFDDQGTFDFNSQINDGQLYSLDFMPEARYIKYEAIEGASNYAFLADFYVYGSIQ